MTEFNAAEYEEIVSAIKPMLAGREPDLQSAVLAELTTLWLVGHADVLRAGMFIRYIELVRKLVPPCEAEVFRGGQHPQNQGLENRGLILTTEEVFKVLEEARNYDFEEEGEAR